ncbi:unnamed protein product [Linum tenue]|uniref:Uncharacterized protein n=2 Tax=Linum tenue TaxID=586396 RepID=A0AAV0QSF9_9ROSI|nr:unnamed protein product [Linum tenue]
MSGTISEPCVIHCLSNVQIVEFSKEFKKQLKIKNHSLHPFRLELLDLSASSSLGRAKIPKKILVRSFLDLTDPPAADTMRPTTTSSAASSSATTTTTTIVLENPAQQQPQPQPPSQTLVLRLNRPKKKVSWKEGTVDNEFMQKKSSKKCCIFHKQKPFDEDDSDEDEDDQHRNHGGGHHDHPSSEGCCSSSNGQCG